MKNTNSNVTEEGGIPLSLVTFAQIGSMCRQERFKNPCILI